MSNDATRKIPYGAAVTAIGLAVLLTASAVTVVGWGMDVAAVRSVVPGAVAMKALAALGLGAGAIALLALARRPSGTRRRLGLALAALPGLLGIAVLSEYVFSVDLGIDELVFVDHAGRAAGIAYPGRFAPTTGGCFVLLSAALLTLEVRTTHRWRLSELFAIPMGTVALMSLLGYAYSIPAFYGPASAAKMAMPTALCFVALSVALLLANPRGRFVELATTTDPGGVMVRRMVPICVIVPLVLGWLHLRTVSWGVFNDEVGTWWMAAATIAGLIAVMWWCASSLSGADRTRRVLEAKLFDLANRDPLTGLFSRHRFEEELDAFLARARRYDDRAAVLLLDLDHLKPINDTFGHAAGDRMLRAVADALTSHVRASDIIARLGGDEYAVLLLETSPEDALAKAGVLCGEIAQIELQTHAGTCRTTISIGIASVSAASTPMTAELLACADGAMYEAKRAGGDQVVLAGQPLAASA